MSNSAPTVLVVDDDPEVLAVAATVLGLEGYTVLQAPSGAEGLKLLQTNPGIDILFTDIVMPGDIDGFELAHRAKQLRPALRVLYTSGYIKEPPWGRHGVGHGPLLPKPWRRDQLRRTIQDLLGDGYRPAPG